jgi:hypothetical protein
MIHKLAPPFLSNLIPPMVNDISPYLLRNSANLTAINARTKQYSESYLPSVIISRNNLHPNVRNSPTVNSFKASLNIGKKNV